MEIVVTLKPSRVAVVPSVYRIDMRNPAKDVQRYFFDVEDGERRHQDGRGLEFGDLTGAIEEAQALLRSLADVNRFTRRPRTSTVRVRNAEGEHVYEGSTDPEEG